MDIPKAIFYLIRGDYKPGALDSPKRVLCVDFGALGCEIGIIYTLRTPGQNPYDPVADLV